MMEKAIKQRLLGGLVLVAGAALFLPVLLDGSGAALTIPPLPKAPEVGGVEALAPRLDQKVTEAEQAVDAAHAGRDDAAPEAAAAPTGEGAGDVAPDAAALVAAEGRPAAVPATATSVPAVTPAPAGAAAKAPAATLPPAPARPAPAVGPSPAPATATPVKPAPAPPTAAPAKPVVATPAPTPAKVVAPAPAVAAKPASTKETAKPAEAKEFAKTAADKALPGAWLVQVGVFSSRDKAQALVQQLRRKGYSAVLTPQGGSFKVVVGPELNRSVADSIKTRLATDPELKLNGWVQAYKP